MENLKETVRYRSCGLVLGTLWGGGTGAYPAIKLNADTKKDLIEQAKKGLDGSLDSGMGFESLLGALLIVTTIRTIEYKGKLYTNLDDEEMIVGNLTPEQLEFLEGVQM